MKPPVWRRIEVPGNVTLADLHSILQTVMSWTNSHLHEFAIYGTRYGVPDDGWGSSKARDETKVRLDKLAGEGAQIEYTYDFGDDWKHEIVVETIAPTEDDGVYPRCLDGERAAPPEDVGGEPGYELFLEAMADPQHPDHEHFREWMGEQKWDPEFFEVTSVNEALHLGL